MGKKQPVVSSLTGKTYNPEETIRIVDITQFALYVKNGLQQVDQYPSIDYETKKPIVVFIFIKKETKECYEKWQKHELK